MEHLVLGILVVVLCITCFVSAWLEFRKARFHTALFLILLAGLALRIYMSSDHYIHEWDERYHALVAKNLIQHPLKPTLYDHEIIPYDYRSWTVNHIWLEKPTVPLWFISASLCFFGNNEFAVRLPSLIISLIAVYFTFLLGKYLFDQRIGLLAAFFHAINGIVLELAGGKLSSDHVETFFNVFIEIAVVLSFLSILKKNSRSYIFWGGIFTGLAVLSKWMPALIVIPVWLTGVICIRKYSLREIVINLMVMISGCLLITLPWFIYFFIHHPLETQWVVNKFLFAYASSIEGHNAPFWYYLNYIGIIFGEIVYIPILFAVICFFRKRGEWVLKSLTVWWLVPVIIFSFAETKRHTYLMLAAPAFFLVTAWFWFYLKDAQARPKFRWLTYTILALLILLPVRFSIERMKPFQRMDIDPEWATELRLLNHKIPEKKVVIFNSMRPVETMFYTDFTAYYNPPDSATVEMALLQGYTVYFYEGSDLIKIGNKR